MASLLGNWPDAVAADRNGKLVTAPAEERALILRVQRGDTAAFEALVGGYVRRARAIAMRLMRNPDDADDLVQDAFLRVLQKIESVDPDRPFGPWFFRVLVNTGLDTHRRHRTRQTQDETAEVASPAPTPAEAAEQSEIRRRFQDALDRLPPRQRQIVWSFELDGMTTREIAEQLGVADVTVRWHLHQGRRALRIALADLRA
jgi:RNA polymerase sigma-70 factor, ECF subfamily